MTNITIRKSKTGYQGFTVIGHAGFADAGEDIVCAAISVLTINTINAIDEFTSDQMKVVSNEEEGLIDCRFEGCISKETILLMDTMVLGFQGIRKQYGKTYIDLTFEEV